MMNYEKMTYRLRDIEAFTVADFTNGKTFMGGDQKWFHTKWQRLSGCGPTTVTNIFIYQTRKNEPDATRPMAKATYQARMEEVWKHVTPTIHGIPTTDLLLKGVPGLLAAHGYRGVLDKLDIGPMAHVELAAVVDFLKTHLQQDIPVAFLTLDIGKEPGLDEWHWVTIVAMDEPRGNDSYAMILDNGDIKAVNLGLWLTTTKKGGGLASFSLQPAQ